MATISPGIDLVPVTLLYVATAMAVHIEEPHVRIEEPQEQSYNIQASILYAYY